MTGPARFCCVPGTVRPGSVSCLARPGSVYYWAGLVLFRDWPGPVLFRGWSGPVLFRTSSVPNRPTEPGQSRYSGGPVAVLVDRAAHFTVTVSSRAGCFLSGCRVPVTEDCKWDTQHSTAQHSTARLPTGLVRYQLWKTFFFYFFTFTFYRLGYFGKKLKMLREVKGFTPVPFRSLSLSPNQV